MFDRKLNGILADEMGLGKTIQTISLLAHLACEKGKEVELLTWNNTVLGFVRTVIMWHALLVKLSGSGQSPRTVLYWWDFTKHFPRSMLYLINIICHFTDNFAGQQVTQCSPLFQFAIGWGPCIVVKCITIKIGFFSPYWKWWKSLFQCIAVNIRFFLIILKEGAGSACFQLA